MLEVEFFWPVTPSGVVAGYVTTRRRCYAIDITSCCPECRVQMLPKNVELLCISQYLTAGEADCDV
jgi:hypothetical protein